MTSKVILIVLDGLNDTVGQQCMGFLQGLVESQRASHYTVNCELPSMSRPLYECLLTGLTPVESGVVNNHIVRTSYSESIFSLAKHQGKITAAAAYHWMSELYNRAPYEAVRDRFTNDKNANIQHGIFYHLDHYPDELLFLDAEHLRRSHDPDFLLIHPMNIDDAGHQHGFDSHQYRNSARTVDIVMSHYLPAWLAAGYQVLITSDHGMNNDFSHGGCYPEEREVPLYVLGERFSHQPCTVAQTEICGTVCELLQLHHSKPFAQELLA